VRIQCPDRPGHYALTGENPQDVLKVFNVNPSPKESLLTYTDSPEVLKAWRQDGAGQKQKHGAGEGPMPPRLAGILQQHIWWWMVVGALLALTMEMVSAGGRRE
ncbi:MAG TPA: hypothetical protein VHI52_19365, partial [Verrucomicrobiae bacterium]|nr:hypothetical protein [Verrucomicrobiae bacterium]